MGNIGTAADNAAMESFFSLLQKNVLNTRSWDTRDQLRIAIVTWIEHTCRWCRCRWRCDGRRVPTIQAAPADAACRGRYTEDALGDPADDCRTAVHRRPALYGNDHASRASGKRSGCARALVRAGLLDSLRRMSGGALLR